METAISGGKQKMRLFLLSVLVLCFGLAIAEGKERLLLVSSRPNIAAGKPVSMDVYLYNDGSKAVKLPALEYLAAEWLLDDAAGKRLRRAGGSERITGYGTPDVSVPAGAVLHRKMKFDIKAEAGDLVTLKVTLGERRAVESNDVLLYCSGKKG
jgi:hypothetical protein